MGELAVVGLAMVIVGKRCAGEECAQNGARGGYKKGDDGVRGDQRGGESRGEFKGGGVPTPPNTTGKHRKIAKVQKPPEHSKIFQVLKSP